MTLLPAKDRELVRPLLDDDSPRDALAAYYALYYDPKRTNLYAHFLRSGRVDGFLVRCQTGYDLFRPLVTFRARSEDTAAELFREGIPPVRPVWLTVPDVRAEWALRHLESSELQRMRIYALDPGAFTPIVNVLVTRGEGPDRTPRYEIRAGETVHAAAGVNWKGQRFAEVFVYTHPAARGRGWGRSVLSTLVGALLKEQVRPLYVVDENNTASIRLAESVGFTDAGEREFACQAVRTIG